MAGPFDPLSMRNMMPEASMARPMTPPRASISRTICPLATPPIAGVQLIWATASAFIVRRTVFNPSRADAIAASTPAWPAPTTATSNWYVREGMGDCFGSLPFYGAGVTVEGTDTADPHEVPMDLLAAARQGMGTVEAPA